MSFSSNEHPWTEVQWETYLREADLRAARFGELLETLQDHPDCEEIVSREMGWDKPVEQDEEVRAFIEDLNESLAKEEWSADTLADDEFDDDPAGSPDIEDDDAGPTPPRESNDGEPPGEEDDDPFSEDEEDREVKRIPAYILAMEVGEQVHQALRPYLNDDVENDEADDRLSEAVINSLLPAAKIAKGHGLGYDDDVLCGNIVCCKAALQFAIKSRQALESLLQDGFLPPALVYALVSKLRRVEQAIEERIELLRAKVWW